MHAYPALDSVVWSAPGAPAMGQVLGFSPDEGVITFVDRANVPGRIYLRLGEVSRAGSRYKLTSAKTVNGQNVSIDASRNGVKVAGATVVQTDIQASNGVIHVIDTVLLPKEN